MALAPRDATSRIVLAAFAAVIVALMIGVVWVSRDAHRSEVALSRDVRTIRSTRSLGELKACFGLELRMDAGRQHGMWRGSATDGGGLKAFNSMTDIGIRLYELGNARTVVVSTRLARALRPAERDAINRCAGT